MKGVGPHSLVLVRILEHHPDWVIAWHERLGDSTVETDAARLTALTTWLRDDSELRFEMLCDLTAVDWLGREPRFDLVYHLRSPELRMRLRVKTAVADEVASVATVWPAADWLEREVFDLYGIHFAGHPDLRRILLDADFEGHPLRKDHPKRGRAGGTTGAEASS